MQSHVVFERYRRLATTLILQRSRMMPRVYHLRLAVVRIAYKFIDLFQTRIVPDNLGSVFWPHAPLLLLLLLDDILLSILHLVALDWLIDQVIAVGKRPNVRRLHPEHHLAVRILLHLAYFYNILVILLTVFVHVPIQSLSLFSGALERVEHAH